MTKEGRFTKDFEEEAVRLVATSGRTQRAVTDDLGIGLSTLVRWVGRSRDRLMEMPTQRRRQVSAVSTYGTDSRL